MRAAFTILLATAFSRPVAEVDQNWKTFLQKYQKTYASVEETAARRVIFEQTVNRIDALNAEDSGAIHGVNQFADLTPEEFKAQYLTYRAPENSPYELITDLSPRVNSTCTATKCDWVSQGAVNKVRDQGQCGSSWAFSTVEQIESDYFLAGNRLNPLSPQQLVDCETQDDGCNGGDPVNAYPYIVTAGGIEGELSYPYTGMDGRCKFSATRVAATITGFQNVVPPCNGALNNCNGQNDFLDNATAYIQNNGPASICVNAGPWQTYFGGVLSTGCSGAHYALDHCVQLTGYGTTLAGKKYWTVRNSWGASWGLDGYIHIAQENNVCGILDAMTVATIN
jgi:cathepsin F